MSRQASNIDKILDISSFTTSRGFIVSSSDEDDDVNELKKSSTTVRSKLSNIFPTTAQKPPKEEQSGGKRQPIFANSVGLFTAGETGELQSRGQVGVAVTDSNGKYILLIYNASKQVIASFLLAPGSFTFSVRYGKDSYLFLSTATASLTLHFDESKLISGLHVLVSLMVLLCGMEGCLLSPGEGEACFLGCHVLLEERQISLQQGELQIEQRPPEKKKLSASSPMLGLGKGGIRIVQTSETSVSIMTAVKIKYPSDRLKVESETSSVVPADSPRAADLSEVEAEVELEREKANDLMTRIAKVGQAIVPLLPPVEQPVENETEKESATTSYETAENGKSFIAEPPIPAPREYPVFHKIVGVEIDRLEIRLEATVQRMVDRALEPLKEDLQRLLKNQETILAELQDLRKIKD